MPTKIQLAGAIAGRLAASEHSMNQAAIDLFQVGIAMMEARNSGHFHPLENQTEVERWGTATQNQMTAIGEIARVHDRLFKKAKELVTDTGDLCPFPSPQKGHAGEGNVVSLQTVGG